MPTFDRKSRYGTYGIVQGRRLNKATYELVERAADLAGWGPVVYVQGGVNAGRVAASAATHAGLDVVDIRTRGHSREQIFRFARYLMECGGVPFIRGVVDRMDPHIHLVTIAAKRAHQSARAQIYDRRYGYRYGGAGLGGAPRARWWGPARKPLVTWAASAHNPRNKPGVYVVDARAVLADGVKALNGRNAKGRVVTRQPPGTRLRLVKFRLVDLGRGTRRYGVDRKGVHFDAAYLNRA